MSKVTIDKWLPQRWEHVVGNQDLVEHYQENLRAMLKGDKAGLNTMVIGPSRSGKTSVTKLFAQSLLCQKLDETTLNPCCVECIPCTNSYARFGQEHLETTAVCGHVHYRPFDCADATAETVADLPMGLKFLDGIRVIYLDEVHRLHRPNSHLEERLLKPVEEKDNCMWIASTVSTADLEPMFVKRFVTIHTQLPTLEELAIWLDDRCNDWKIDYDKAETLILLAERASLVPGLALQVLARADKKTPRLLTRKLVEEHIFTD